MIRELSELGKKIRKVSQDALKEELISIDLVINQDGSFHSFIPFDKKMTTAEAITAKKGKARLLLDKAEEVLNYGGNASTKKHKLFLEKLEQYKDLAELKPVIAFYYGNKANGLDKAILEFEKAIPEKERKGNIGFRIRGKDTRIHEEPNVYQKIIDNYEANQKILLSKLKTMCSICGKTDYPVIDDPHGMIKRVPDGKTSGCALVSYNEKAFESYGLKGNNNSAICTNCAKTYVEGLNWLLCNGNPVTITENNGKEKESFRYTNRKQLGSDTAMVFWTRENTAVEEMELLDTPDEGKIANLIDSVTSGDNKKSRYLETDRFYSFTLSGSAARIAVRDWVETSLISFQKSIATWFRDIAIDHYDFDLKKSRAYYSRLYELARCCQRKNQNESYDKNDVASARIAAYLWKTALKNTVPPLWILVAVLKRARLDKNGVTPERAALIKLILLRNFKGGIFMDQKKVEGRGNPAAYVCGQIFAVLESIQYAALGKTNAGIREKYFTFALTNPAPAFGRLFSLSSKHFTKLKGEKPGLAVVLDRELQSLCKEIKIEEFPAIFTLEEQGQFAIGYYHQRQKQFNRAELKEIVEEEQK
ncbi:type I-C CRISPR-associated protein Cas8c/Csd1 [bacterium]|nr:type I-C CRISPR-associated protein Cas8c/Csd1 [bacterium]MBU3954825.1 type I-C CRISPR-associated protein Cas8c/Csd1 [bacterium]